MANYLGSHRGNILEEINLPSWRNIKRGDIIYANYRSESTKRVEPKLYIVLQTYWPKADGKMHVLDLNYIAPEILKKRLLKHTVQKQPLEEKFGKKTYTRLDFSQDEKSFYESVVRGLIKDGFGPSYRTIFPMNLTKIRVIDYEWFDNRTEDTQGITQEEFEKTQKQ